MMKKGGERKTPGTMDIILVIVGVCAVTFTAVMIWLFCLYGAIPDTLVTCVFAILGGECSVMGWIKTTKERERSFQERDETSSGERSLRERGEASSGERSLRERSEASSGERSLRERDETSSRERSRERGDQDDD